MECPICFDSFESSDMFVSKCLLCQNRRQPMPTVPQGVSKGQARETNADIRADE